jgi:hypothetical protein
LLLRDLHWDAPWSRAYVHHRHYDPDRDPIGRPSIRSDFVIWCVLRRHLWWFHLLHF